MPYASALQGRLFRARRGPPRCPLQRAKLLSQPRRRWGVTMCVTYWASDTHTHTHTHFRGIPYCKSSRSRGVTPFPVNEYSYMLHGMTGSPCPGVIHTGTIRHTRVRRMGLSLSHILVTLTTLINSRCRALCFGVAGKVVSGTKGAPSVPSPKS